MASLAVAGVFTIRRYTDYVGDIDKSLYIIITCIYTSASNHCMCWHIVYAGLGEGDRLFIVKSPTKNWAQLKQKIFDGI